MNLSNLYKLISIIIISFSIPSCQKYIDVKSPSTGINEANVYTANATCIAVLTGIYATMSTESVFSGNASISFFSGLSSDELTLYSGVTSPNYIAYYTNALGVNNPSTTYGSEQWTFLYNYVYNCNAAIEGLNGSEGLTLAVKQQLLGEAKFSRAFFYFYLVNLFGDVPMPLTTDYKSNSVLARTPAHAVYQQIIADLKDAQKLLSPVYLDATLLNNSSERVRPTQWAADALLARTYLYTNQWDSAELASTAVIGNSSLFELNNLNDVFLANSTEAIWQLQPVTYGQNTQDAITYIIASTGPSNVNGGFGNPVYLSSSLLNSFEPNDQRMVNGNWIDTIAVSGTTYYYPYKYKSANFGDPVTEYLMVLRLGEQFLIRAEARAEQGEIAGAESDVNMIRARAGLPPTPANDKSSLLAAIMKERRVELFTEGANRWLDLKRSGTIDAVMTNVTLLKGGIWKSNQQLYPLPESDILMDQNLIQNAGY